MAGNTSSREEILASVQDSVADYNLSDHGSIVEDIEAWMQRYEDSLVRISSRTKKAYNEALGTFRDYCVQYDNIVPIESISATLINKYIIYYIGELAAKDLGLRTKKVPNKRAHVREVPTKRVISEEEYKEYISNNGKPYGRDHSNIYVPYRYEKTVLHRITILKQFLRFISANNKELHDFTHLFPKIADIVVQKRRTTYLDKTEMGRLVMVCEEWPEIYKKYVSGTNEQQRRQANHASEFVAWRNSFLVLLYATTGMRASEALEVTLQDFKAFDVRHDGEKVPYFSIRVLKGKGDKEREVTAPAEPIIRHLDYMREVLLDERTPLGAQSPASKKVISYANLYQYAKNIYRAARINGKSGFHMIRRGYATNELLKGKDIEQVALQLGHSSPKTTYESYVKSNPELLAVYKGRRYV